MHKIETYPITYEFIFKDNRSRTYDIHLNKQTIAFIQKHSFQPPPWTHLDKNQCKGCPLQKSTSPHCPIAVNIAELVDHFKNEPSTGEVMVRVTTPERTYSKETSVQVGLFSILGIIMSTSGCPVMHFLKPMARFHLPFSTSMETLVRSTSMYLLRQYFKKKTGREVDFDLKDLDRRYECIQNVNEGMLSRIRTFVSEGDSGGDSEGNALVILHSFSQLLSMEIAENLNSFQYLFTEE